MTPLPTPAEVLEDQKVCREAWEKSLLSSGTEKMKLISQAHPHAIDRSNSEGALYLHWNPKMKSFMVGDYGGFITMIPEDDLNTLTVALKMEFQIAGAFRQMITGEKARPRINRPKQERTQKVRISLGDLDL